MPKKCLVLFLCVFSLCLYGCRRADTDIPAAPDARISPSGTPAASPAPSETPVQKHIEEQVLNMWGFEIPFDYTDKELVMMAEMVMVAVFDDDRIYNQGMLDRFIDDLYDGKDCGVIIVHCTGYEPAGRTALLHKNGLLMGEQITDQEIIQYTFTDISDENGCISGVTQSGEKIVLGTYAYTPQPKPVDVSGKLDWFYDVEDVTLSWFIADALDRNKSLEKKMLTLSEQKELMDALLSGPAYYALDVEDQVANPLDLRVSVRSGNHDLYFNANMDGSVSVGSNGVRYISFSKPLFDMMMGYIGMDAFSRDMIADVASMTLRYKEQDGAIQEKIIDDPAVIDPIIGAIKAAAENVSRSWFESNAEMIIHTPDGDITCSFCIDMPEAPANEVVIDSFYWYASQEAADIVRALLP